jgi:hypothetical protein
MPRDAQRWRLRRTKLAVQGFIWGSLVKDADGTVSTYARGLRPPPRYPETTAQRRLRQSQGGGLPFWQTTAVPLACGTTTVVLAGGGGLLLLMQPASSPAASTALNSTFMGRLLFVGHDVISRAQFWGAEIRLCRGAARVAMSSAVLQRGNPPATRIQYRAGAGTGFTAR